MSSKKKQPKKIESEGETLLLSSEVDENELDFGSLVEEDETEDELSSEDYPDLGNDVLNENLTKIGVSLQPLAYTRWMYEPVGDKTSGLLNKTNGIRRTRKKTAGPNVVDASEETGAWFDLELRIWFSVENMVKVASSDQFTYYVDYDYITYNTSTEIESQPVKSLEEFEILEFEEGMVLCRILFSYSL